MAGDDQKVIFLGAVLAHLAEGDAESFGTDPRCLGQDFHQIALAKREAAKPCDRGLLTQQLLDLGSGIGHGTARLRCRVVPRKNMDLPATDLYP